MYMNDNKLFVKNEKELEILIQAIRIYRQDIKMEFRIEKCVILIMKIREKTNNGMNRTSKSGKHQNS